MPHSTDGTLTDYFIPEVLTVQEYFVFGFAIPNRNYNLNKEYRYGFNGKENDNEIRLDSSGDPIRGSEQDYGNRIYDSKVGRFLSVDPISKSYPELTPYQFASNRPIDGVDQDGLEWDMSGKSNIVTPQMAQNINSNVSKAVIGYVNRVENTDEALKRSWEFATGQPPSFPMRMKMGFSAFMMNSQEANHLVNPAQIGIDAESLRF